MIVFRHPQDIDLVGRPEIRGLAQRRFQMLLSEDEVYESDIMGYFMIVESGDSLETLSKQLGFDVLANRYTGVRFDDPAFAPSFEFLEEYRTCYEIVFVISDDGFGATVFVSKEEGIDPDLLAMCSMYAVPSQESEP